MGLEYTEERPSILTRAEREELARLWLLEGRGLSLEEQVRRNALEDACRYGRRPEDERRVR